MPKANDTDIYKYDTNISVFDYLFGSDINDFRKNKSYRIKDIIALANATAGANLFQYYFSDGSTMGVDYNTPGFMFTDNNDTAVGDFDKIIFNKKTEEGLSLATLFDFISTTPNIIMRIENATNPNNFFVFEITDFLNDTEFIAFSVIPYKDLYLGELLNNGTYFIYWDVKGSNTLVDSDTIEFTPTTANVKPKSITFDKIKDILFKTFLGRNTASNGEVEEVTMTQARNMLDINNVDNTSDVNKPVSSPQLTALNLKANQSTTYTKTEVDAKVSSVYKIKGSVANFASLPSTGQLEGDVWNLLDNGDNYAWVLDLNNTGIPGWDKLSGNVDLTAITADLATKQAKPIIISANKTAVVNEVYNNIGNNIYTDPTTPTPVNGNIYTVNILSGTATIGGVGYTSGIVQRSFNGTIWSSEQFINKTQLDLKANLTDLDDYLQHTGFDFQFNTISTGYPYTVGAFNGGTLTLQSDSIGFNKENRPNDIIECWTINGNASNINSGYRFGVGPQNPMYVGSIMFMVIRPLKLSNLIGRFGLIQNEGLAPNLSLTGNNNICLEFEDDKLRFKAGLGGSQLAAPQYTIPNTNFLYIMFEPESLTEVRCKIRNSLNGTLVYNELLSSIYVPISQTGVSWHGLRIANGAMSKTASADGLFQVARQMTKAKKPHFLKDF